MYCCCCFFWIQFNVPAAFQDYFTHIETSQSVHVGEAKRSTPEKPPDTPASRAWFVSHVASMGLEPTPDTAVNVIFVGYLNNKKTDENGYSYKLMFENRVSTYYSGTSPYSFISVLPGAYDRLLHVMRNHFSMETL